MWFFKKKKKCPLCGGKGNNKNTCAACVELVTLCLLRYGGCWQLPALAYNVGKFRGLAGDDLRREVSHQLLED